jgi:hypothetical protein
MRNLPSFTRIHELLFPLLDWYGLFLLLFFCAWRELWDDHSRGMELNSLGSDGCGSAPRFDDCFYFHLAKLSRCLFRASATAWQCRYLSPVDSNEIYHYRSYFWNVCGDFEKGCLCRAIVGAPDLSHGPPSPSLIWTCRHRPSPTPSSPRCQPPAVKVCGWGDASTLCCCPPLPHDPHSHHSSNPNLN